MIRDRPPQLSITAQSAMPPYLHLRCPVLPRVSCEMRALLVLACLVISTARVPLQEFSSSKGPLQNVIHLRLPGAEDIIVVGGRNALYKLSAENVSLLATYVTGPEDDSLLCRPSPYYCNHTRPRVDNDNQVLLQLPSPHVLACGTISQGMCAVHRPLEGLTVAEPMYVGSTINYVASRVSTVAFFGTGDNRNVLFVASTYDGRPPEYHPYAVSARVLDEGNVFRMRSSAARGSSFVNVIGRYKRKHKIRYLHGFSHKGFAYFVAVQKGLQSPMAPETRLARVCENDTSFRTYTEILITCGSGNHQYTNASSAAYGPHTADDGSSDKVLLVAFALHDENGTKNSRSKFALCLFHLDRIEGEFRDTIKNCNDGKQEAARWSRLFNNGDELTCQVYKPRSDDMCLPGINNYIEGVAPLLGTSMVTLRSAVTSLTVTQQNQAIVAWVGDQKGNLHKVISVCPFK
ncbi:hypothetical protein HPB49_001464 [Dermacentor silvarum]|uniref:Uncharacterized protein n=1 Tax=Dermacentor silvarum TaxID=543639 RepID=A0ACB8C6T1_DERSI|nr:hypothetical protein HPB49_001464 [Dermacentor silvarum]